MRGNRVERFQCAARRSCKRSENHPTDRRDRVRSPTTAAAAAAAAAVVAVV